MSFASREEQLRRDFNQVTDWEDRYKKLIEWGKALPALPSELQTEENKVRGCQSQVWLTARLSESGTVEFQGDSDALLVKGLVAVLLRLYSGLTPSEILSHAPSILKELGFEANLSPSRANGLHSMLKQIRHYAVAFDYLLKSQKKN